MFAVLAVFDKGNVNVADAGGNGIKVLSPGGIAVEVVTFVIVFDEITRPQAAVMIKHPAPAVMTCG